MNPRDIAGNAEEEAEEDKMIQHVHTYQTVCANLSITTYTVQCKLTGRGQTVWVSMATESVLEQVKISGTKTIP